MGSIQFVNGEARNLTIVAGVRFLVYEPAQGDACYTLRIIPLDGNSDEPFIVMDIPKSLTPPGDAYQAPRTFIITLVAMLGFTLDHDYQDIRAEERGEPGHCLYGYIVK